MCGGTVVNFVVLSRCAGDTVVLLPRCASGIVVLLPW